MPNQGTRVFTFSADYDRIVPVLISPVDIQPAFDPSKTKPHSDGNKFKAIWDTGATHTNISEHVVNSCNLKATGMATLKTAGGEKNSPTYFVSVYLPNRVYIPQLRVSQTDIYGADVLIGMDIISYGDFAVTNKDKKTCLSFRIPSVEKIDFTGKAPPVSDNKPVPKVGRNDPCPCGSGKKYKHCCGR